MKNIKKELLKIRKILDNHLFKDVPSEILKLAKKNKLYQIGRVILSDYLELSGEFDLAFSILGHKSIDMSIDIRDEEEAIYYAACALKLSYKGAKYISQTYFDYIDSQMIQWRKQELRYKIYKMTYCYINYYHKDGLNLSNEILDKIDENHGSFKRVLLFKTLFLQGVGSYKNSIKLIKQLESYDETDYRIGQFKAMEAEISYMLRDFKKSKSLFIESLKMREGTSLIDSFYAYKWLSHLYFLDNEVEQALECINKSYNYFLNLKSFPNALIEVLHFKNKISPDKMSFFDLLLLKTYFGYAPFSYLNGQNADEKTKESLPYFLKQSIKLDKIENDVWLLKYGLSIELVNYNDTHEEENYIDLVSGIFKLDKEIKILPEIYTKCLYALLSSSYIGVNKYALLDYVYCKSFISFEDGLNKLSKLIKSLKKLGFKIEIEKSSYILKDSPVKTLFLPMKNKKTDILNFIVKRLGSRFELKAVMELFKYSNAKAKSLINKLVNENEIKKDQSSYLVVK